MLSLATMGAGRYNFSCFNRMLLRLFTIAVIMLSLPLGFSAGSEAQEISGYKVALRNFVFSHPTPLSVQEQKELARKLRAEDLEFSGDSWQGTSQIMPLNTSRKHIKIDATSWRRPHERSLG